MVFAVYRGVDGHADSEDYRELLADIARSRLAGLIVIAPTDEVQMSDLIQVPQLPTVALLGRPIGQVPVVHAEPRSFYRNALNVMRRQGRRKPAVIAFHKHLPLVAELIREADFEPMPHLLQAANLQSPQSVNNLVRLLARDSEVDTLIIADDTLIEHAQAGLVAAGVNVPEDLLLIEQCNWPWPVPSVLPSTRIGFDITELLDQCMKLLDTVKNKQDVPRETVVQARIVSQPLDEPTNNTSFINSIGGNL